ncbi:hypothetical protein [Parasphingorhabdus sp.]|uniref:hypothetical protein n=1 Tax=Parasphingorhabdus sp. TaxID=2709688 RepID=UPI0030014580
MLPKHGRLDCTRCFGEKSCDFDKTAETSGDWRIVNNPLAWGNQKAEIAVLGFSKGPNQRGALATKSVDEVAFERGRTPLAKILHHIRLIERPDRDLVDSSIEDVNSRFHFGSLVRCSVERYDTSTGEWTGTGAGMLDRFVKKEFGHRVVGNCIEQHLGNLPMETKLVILLGMGSKGNYIRSCKEAFRNALGGNWEQHNEVAYSDGNRMFVHTEHFKSQGALLPNWLSESQHERGRLGLLAREAVAASGVVTV